MGMLYGVGGCFVFLWLCLPSLGQCQVTVTQVTNSPPQPIENGNVTLTGYATGFDPNVHLFSWQRSNNVDVISDHRISFSPANLFAETELGSLYSQNLTITNLTKPDEGFYPCVIIRKDNGNVIANGQGQFTVNSTEEFPVCFPDGPALVNEGDILTCRTVIDERSAVVSDTKSPVERVDFDPTLLTVNKTGSQLQKKAIVSDDGVTFFCYSITPDNANWTSLSCKMGPLTVIPHSSATHWVDSTNKPGLSVGAIIGIGVGAVFLVILLTTILVCTVYRRHRNSDTATPTVPIQPNRLHIYEIPEDAQSRPSADPNPTYANVIQSLHGKDGGANPLYQN